MQNEMSLSEIRYSDGPSSTVNISQTERIASTIAAPLLAYVGVKRGGITGIVLGMIAAEMVYRGATGHSPLYQAIGMNTAVAHPNAQVSVPHEQGLHVEQSIFIARPRSELYDFWRNLSNLPRFIPYLKSVSEMGDRYSHWVANGPFGLIQLKWDAEIINEIEDEVIAWRTLPGSMLAHAGSVRFEPSPDNLGTIVRVEMEYAIPGGKIGHTLTEMLGAGPDAEITESLECFRTLMETGKMAKAGKKSYLPFGGTKPDKVVPGETRRREIERRADYVQMTSEDSFPASDPPASW